MKSDIDIIKLRKTTTGDDLMKILSEVLEELKQRVSYKKYVADALDRPDLDKEADRISKFLEGLDLTGGVK